MNNQGIELLLIIMIAIGVTWSFYLSSRGTAWKGVKQISYSRSDIDLIYGPQLERMRAEMEMSKADCAQKIQELERRVEFLLSVIMSSDKPMRVADSYGGYSSVLVMSSESVYAAAIKMSGIPVSIVERGDLVSALSMIPRDSVRGDYGVVVCVSDDWSGQTNESLDRVGDVSNRVFFLVGVDSDRVASFLGMRSRGAVAVSVTALVSSTRAENLGGTQRDSNVEGNIAAFCAAFVSGVVKSGVSVERAYEMARESASSWVIDRARLYRK